MEDLLDNSIPYILGGFLLLVLGVFLFLITAPFWYYPMVCKNKYEDTKYNAAGGCMIKYGSGYIPEELYHKQFMQNIGISHTK